MSKITGLFCVDKCLFRKKNFEIKHRVNHVTFMEFVIKH